ncbi:hypothetical protein HYV70_04555 [Candidatus Uhrbacteria bacterium]|nr:hypothetical protein [Candidatus Uhrbacteria bacterium]
MSTPETLSGPDPREAVPSSVELGGETREGLEEGKGEVLEPSPEEKLEKIEERIESREQRIEQVVESIEKTKADLAVLRENLGLPPLEEIPFSISSDERSLEDLQTEHDALEKQKEELVNQQEKHKLIEEEKAKILQEKIDELFKQFEGLGIQDLESLFNTGKMSNGQPVESKSMGLLDPEMAKSLVQAFKEGVKLLPNILKALPDLLKKFDEDLTKEAKERVEKKLEEEKKVLKQEEKKEEQGEQSEESIIGLNESEQEGSVVEPVKIENPHV